jgi:hypothetical protein
MQKVIKIHFLDSHSNFFAANMAAISDEHGERISSINILDREAIPGQTEPHHIG